MANPEDLGRFRLKRLLGRGVLGEVWEASDAEEGSKVCVKIMHAADDELALARSHFAREGRLASLLRHPHVVLVHDAGEAAGTSFLVMDMVEGVSLRHLLKGKELEPPATQAEKVDWLLQVAEGLSALHHGGVVHRDLKPANVIIRPDRTACIVDFGFAKWTKFDLGGSLPDDEEIERPPPMSQKEPTIYVPPETTDGELFDEMGDQFAWGILGYELLTGHAPTPESPPLTKQDDVPRSVARAVDRARQLSRADRFESIDDLIACFADDAPSKSSAPPAPVRLGNVIDTPLPPGPPAKPGPKPLLLVGALLALVALAVAVVAAVR